MKRVIFVEPNIENNNDILSIFQQNNIDSKIVNPHICLVFPFESELPTEYIEKLFSNLEILDEFYIELQGLSVSYEKDNNFLFLNVINDVNLTKLSEYLYKGLNGNAKLKGEYIPHITLAKNKSKYEIDKLYELYKDQFNEKLKLKVDKIYSKIICLDKNNELYLQDELEFSFRKNSNIYSRK